MPSTKKLLQAAAGSAGGDPLYVEDVFSTYLYEGTGSARAINNGIDLDGEGGAVWIKHRTGTNNHELYDTERGAGKVLYPDITLAEGSGGRVDGFNSNGFDLTSGASANQSGQDYASWTFRKAEKFFDVVTYTGDGTSNRQISHNLGSTPGFILIKRTDSTGNWLAWHKEVNPGYGILDLTLAFTTGSNGFFDSVTDTYFETSWLNTSGGTFVAYLFASDAGGFGDDGDENIIKCGSYTGNGGTQSIDVGFEPQFLLVKNASAGSTNWRMVDTMRGWSAFNGTNSVFSQVAANLSAAEADTGQLALNSTGFQTFSGNGEVNGTGNTIIYIAIRRPMKTPESGTEVFATDTRGSTGDGKAPTYRSPFPVDMQFNRNRTYAGGNTQISARLAQGQQMFTDLTAAESANVSMAFDYMNGVQTDTGTGVNQNAWMFKRATGFFDVVAYTGNGTASRQITHNLGVAPELLIVKGRSTTNNGWQTWHKALPDDGAWASNVFLNSSDSYGGFQRFDGAATQTANYFTTGNSGEPNTSSQTYIAYLFATLAGVSKVGSYTGTGSNVDVDCGFSAGARFILIKRADSTGDWYYWDSLRGISAGNDPYLLLNSTAAQVTNTDYIDPLSSGFTVTSSAPAALNASGGNYIFLAIA